MKYQGFAEYKGYRIGGGAIAADILWRSVLTIERSPAVPEAFSVLPLCDNPTSAVMQALAGARSLIDGANFTLHSSAGQFTIRHRRGSKNSQLFDQVAAGTDDAALCPGTS
jgi:hypothetical protein